MCQQNFDKNIADAESANRFRIKLADEEFKALSGTLRDRLINSVSAKKSRVAKEKEALDIADSNAHLLHPSQFSITNPSSPGGMHGKRATRHRREIDEPSAFADSHKRKRKLADDDASPAPNRRALDNGTGTPLWHLERNRETTRQVDSPLYSINKLFTEKELSMNYNHAALAAHEYVISHKIRASGAHTPLDGGSSSGSGEHDATKDTTGDGDMDATAPTSPPTAPTMERTFSHATRSTRGAGYGGHDGAIISTRTGLELLSDLSLPGNFARISSYLPKLPPVLPAVMQRGYDKQAANSPSSIPYDELQAELRYFKQSKALEDESGVVGRNLDENGDKEILKAVLAPQGMYAGWFQKEKASRHSGTHGMARDEHASVGNLRVLEEAMGGVPMSAQTSFGGSEVGAPMSRTATGEGNRRRRA